MHTVSPERLPTARTYQVIQVGAEEVGTLYVIYGKSTRFTPRPLKMFLEASCFAHFSTMTAPIITHALFGLQLLAICFTLYFFSCSSRTFLFPKSNNYFSSAHHFRLSVILFNVLYHAHFAASVLLANSLTGARGEER